MQLVLDFGNTYQKCAVFDKDMMIYSSRFEDISVDDIKVFLQGFNEIESCILSSVINTKIEIVNYLKEIFSFIELKHDTPLPIINNYKSPKTLGKDRLAAAVAANLLSGNSASLSIDVGTAIKFDFVNEKGIYLGGSIAPGLFLRFKALHTFTAKLPLVNYNNVHDLIGNNTETSILSGVMNGAIAEINGLISKYKEQFGNMEIFITGGESIYFENHIKSNIFAVSNLVLIGLNEILQFNEEKY